MYVLVDYCQLLVYNKTNINDWWYIICVNMFIKKMWFKNFILILIPTLISVIGVVISNVSNQTFKLFLIISTIILLIILISFMIYSSNFEESIYQKLQQMKDKNIYLTSILAHMENDYKTATFEISSFSDLTEKWA